MEPLSVTSFLDAHKLLKSQDPLKKTIAKILLTQSIDPEAIHTLLTPLKEREIRDHSDYRKSLQSLLCVVLFADLSESVKEEVSEDLTRLFFRLRQAPFEEVELESLMAHLIGVEIELSDCSSEWNSLEVEIETELYRVLRSYRSGGDLLPFRRFAQEVAICLDRNGQPFWGYQQREESFLRIEKLTLYFLTFFSAARLSGDFNMQMKADQLLKQLEKEECIEIPAHLILLYIYFDLKLEGVFSDDIAPIPLPLVKNGAIVGCNGYLDYSLTLRGCGTGLGAIHKEKVKILSYGPQHRPIGSMENFGIWSTTSEGEYRQEKGAVVFSGFARLVRPGISAPEPGDHFLFQRCSISEEGLNIKIEFDEEIVDPLIAFFIRADSAHVEQKILKPLSLDRYFGAARQAVFKVNEEAMTLKSRSHLHIIPLAGGNHFWSADFLVIYEGKSSDNIINIEVV